MWMLAIIGVVGVALSCRFNWWRRDSEGIPILMYHHIDRPPRDERNKKLWILPEKFDRQMAYLKRHGYESITFSDLREHLRKGLSLPERPVIITFDDGAENVYTNGFPILRRYGFRACLFLIAEGSTLKPYQLKEMEAYGMEFGSHTKTHPNLLDVDDEKAKDEIWGSKRILEERLGKEIIVFAYPYGQGAYDEGIRKIVEQAGYFFGCGIKRGKQVIPIENRYCLNRVLVRGDDLMIDFALKLRKGMSRL